MEKERLLTVLGFELGYFHHRSTTLTTKFLNIIRVTIIDFQKVGQKGLKNEDKVGQKFI